MPASTPSKARESEGPIREIVARLARPDGDGGAVIERAAIVAEGEQAVAIEAWIMAHGGEPEVPLVRPPGAGLHGPRAEHLGGRLGTLPPRRYVLPVTQLDPRL